MTMIWLRKARIQVNDVDVIISASKTFMKHSLKPAAVLKNVKKTGQATKYRWQLIKTFWKGLDNLI